jgi:superfamily I DNA/RNA helicase
MKILKLFGPPGTGKTTRCIKELENFKNKGIPLSRIGYLTFTKAARAEARKRLEVDKDSTPYFGTIHSICFRQKGLNRSEIVTGKQLQDFTQYSKLQFSRYLSAEGTYKTKGDFFYMIHNLGEARLLTPEQTAREYRMPREFLTFVSQYNEWKENQGLLDFNNVIEDANPIDIDACIIDEAQDLSKRQWCAVWKLVANCKEVIIAGDDDQSIFEWAGADSSAMIDIEADKEYLQQSYRVPRNVHLLATKIIKRVHKREPKAYKPKDSDGLVKQINDIRNLNLEGDWLILHRNHCYIRDTIEHLTQIGLPFTIQGTGYETVFTTGANLALKTWTRLQQDKEVNNTEINRMMKFISQRMLTRKARSKIRNKLARKEVVTKIDFFIADWFDALDKISDTDKAYMRVLIAKKNIFKTPTIRLSTIHNAKGDEADNVLLIGKMSPMTRKNKNMNLDSELRVWYVAVTRAREQLYICPEIPV